MLGQSTPTVNMVKRETTLIRTQLFSSRNPCWSWLRLSFALKYHGNPPCGPKSNQKIGNALNMKTCYGSTYILQLNQLWFDYSLCPTRKITFFLCKITDVIETTCTTNGQVHHSWQIEKRSWSLNEAHLSSTCLAASESGNFCWPIIVSYQDSRG